MKLASTVICLLNGLVLMSGCSIPQRMADTPSGRPEIVLNSSNLDMIKEEIMFEMQKGDFFLEDDSKYRLQFSRELEGRNLIVGRLLVGSSYGTTPRAEISFNIVPLGEETKVIVYMHMSSQTRYGQVNRDDIKSSNAWFNDFYTLLLRIKDRVGGRSSHGTTIVGQDT